MTRPTRRSGPRFQQAETPQVQSLREVVSANAECCFLDTDGVTRDAQRMLDLMDGWQPNRSDGEAGVLRNRAFNPELAVVVTAGTRISYADGISSEPALLFTIVASSLT